MTQIIAPNVGPSLKEQFSFERAKKAYSAGITGAVAGAGTISISGIFADGKIDGPEVLAAGGAIVGGFVAFFFAAWLPSQTVVPTIPKGDALVPGDGLGDDGEPKHLAESA